MEIDSLLFGCEYTTQGKRTLTHSISYAYLSYVSRLSHIHDNGKEPQYNCDYWWYSCNFVPLCQQCITSQELHKDTLVLCHFVLTFFTFALYKMSVLPMRSAGLLLGRFMLSDLGELFPLMLRMLR